MGKNVWLNEAESGHYMIPLIREKRVQDVFAINLMELEGNHLERALNKLHAQFGHPRKLKLTGLLKDAKLWSEKFNNILENIETNCQICKRYKKTPARPVVALPMAKEFNDAVCMDLKTWREGWLLHLIDMHTRYTRSIAVSRKLSNGIIDKIMQEWISIFGVMKKIMSI